MYTTKLYGIIYGDKQTEFTPYVNQFTTNRHRFENDPIIDIVHNHAADLCPIDWLGIFPWKFKQKTRLTPDAVTNIISQADGETDVINFSPYLGNHIHFMNWSDEGHAGIRDYIRRCCAHVGIDYIDNPPHIIYANLFVARYYIYLHYANTVLIPCLQLLEGEMWPEVNRPSGYTAGMELAELKRHTGLDFYNYVPFIMERMFMQYAHWRGLSIYSPLYRAQVCT
jgi:hypothetical protein